MTERDGSILVVDVGTSGVRGAVVRPDATVGAVHHREVLPSSPAPGLVEFEPSAMADAALEVARTALAEGGPVAAVGLSNQRASTVVWDRATGEPVGPGLGWQDLRTVGACLVWQAQGLRFAPNESATKLAHLLDEADPDRKRDLCFGTVDTWIAWHLSEGALHVTDLSNAAVTGLVRGDASAWDRTVLEALRVPESVLPALVDTSGVIGPASALPGAPPLAALAGDQQASLVGQGCVLPGLAKITFGTGGMLDVCVGPERPAFDRQGKQGTFPIVAWRREGKLVWGVEAVMLAAGTNVEWLRDDIGLIATAEESHD
ncbi:MAG TPA: FGGY family carbohydrate kinase, partial [Acidimicrobiales bacterium]|nr:FGGY family carbohydrate kinase [Acidimicrobiales bacterium]